MGVVVAILLMLAGVAGVILAAVKAHQSERQLDFIRTLGQDADLDAHRMDVPEHLQAPIVMRVFGPTAQWFRTTLARLYPSRDIDRVHVELLRAGLTGTVRAEEFVALQMASVLMGLAVGLTALITHFGGQKLGVFLLVVLPIAGFVGPSKWLGRRIKTRRDTVTNDLPDVLDLMTISVAAGLGLEQSMQVTCAHFESPVCDELALTLREMELGLSRHDALENLKLRTDIDDLVTFSVVLSQADMLGLPIGRVLQAQGDEMRDKRRQRARERAAKVPVKILFPLAFCFLPAIMILVVGPLVGPIKHALAGGA
jgi:tight adherence protein C